MRLGSGRALAVRLRGYGAERPVGRLAWRDRRAWFEFDPGFLATGLDLSPFHLPRRPGVHQAPLTPFSGLFGLFDDSLPDGWGRLLQDRQATRLGLSPGSLRPIDRLAVVGRTGLGALVYEPELGERERDGGAADLDELATAAAHVLDGAADDVLPELLRLGGSPHGARPKVLVWLRPADHHVATGTEAPSDAHRRVLVKFAARSDGPEAGAVEFAVHTLAQRAGVVVPEAWLIPSERCAGWFAVERFDRDAAGASRHVQTLCGLLHADHRLPSLDYIGAHAAVHRLTGDHRAVAQLFRRMVFNITVHNRDDHSKQFSLRLEPDPAWVLAPAYDLTIAEGPGGEHSTAVAGRGHPDLAAVLEVAAAAGIGARAAQRVVEEVTTAADGWPTIALSAAARRLQARFVRLR